MENVISPLITADIPTKSCLAFRGDWTAGLDCWTAGLLDLPLTIHPYHACVGCNAHAHAHACIHVAFPVPLHGRERCIELDVLCRGCSRLALTVSVQFCRGSGSGRARGRPGLDDGLARKRVHV